MMNIFIDANIWLSLYDFSNDDLEQFNKLSTLVNIDLNILLPNQVKQEVFRNRENKINDVLKRYVVCSKSIPNIFKGYEEFATLQNLTTDLFDIQSLLIQKIKEDVIGYSLHADKVIEEIFSKIGVINHTGMSISKAIERFNVGNPPGKDKKYGDAINWVSLLENAPNTEDLFFITADRDYCSVLNSNAFNPFLLREWQEQKGSQLYYYDSLSRFLKVHVKQIELKHEREKEEVIASLSESGSFRNSHDIITKLRQYTNWTPVQVSALCQAASNNSQVSMIIMDDDVNKFFKCLLYSVQSKDTDYNVKMVQELLSDVQSNEDEEISF